MAKKRGKRFPLLIYAPLGQRWSRLGLVLALISLAFWIVWPFIFAPTPWRHLAFFPVLAGGILFAYGYAARKMAFVQCSAGAIRIQTPIYPLVMSYRRIEGTRPVQTSKLFDIGTEKQARRIWPSRFWGMTAIVVQVKQYPVSEQWLRLWFDRYLFNPEDSGLVLLVEDWLELSQQLDSHRAACRTRKSRQT